MTGSAMLRNAGKALAYLGVIAQVWLFAKSPFAGNMAIAAHAVCASVWISGLLLFQKGLKS